MSETNIKNVDSSAWQKVHVRPLHAHEVTNQGGPDIFRLVEPIDEGSPELLSEVLKEGKDKLEALST